MEHTKEYYATRKRITPTLGKVYRNDNGSLYRCIGLTLEGAIFRAVKGTYGKWECTCHGVGQYEDGAIDWDYSTNGHFA